MKDRSMRSGVTFTESRSSWPSDGPEPATGGCLGGVPASAETATAGRWPRASPPWAPTWALARSPWARQWRAAAAALVQRVGQPIFRRTFSPRSASCAKQDRPSSSCLRRYGGLASPPQARLALVWRTRRNCSPQTRTGTLSCGAWCGLSASSSGPRNSRSRANRTRRVECGACA